MKNYTLQLLRVVVMCIAAMQLSVSGLTAQETKNRIEGTIFDQQGNPVSGARITVRENNSSTESGRDGRFTVGASVGNTLTVSHMSFAQTEQTVISDTPMRIVMEERATEMEEMVVVGYGVQRKSDLTAAISSVKGQDLVSTSVTSLDQGLQGRAAGVVVLTTSGQPGGATSVRIRGTTSIYGTNEPLYVIDGVPVISNTNDTSTGGLKNPALNPLASINPNDIESLEVLKDASATSIYGARGANGVILVTTKKGRNGAARVSGVASFAMQQVARTMPMLNALELATLGNEAADNDAQYNLGISPRNPVYGNLNDIAKHSTDWQDEIFRVAPMQNYSVSVSGGSDGNNYFISGNLLSQEGIIIGSNFNKGTLRVNLDQAIGKYARFGIMSNANYSVSNGVVTDSEGAFPSSITSWALEMNPALTVKDAQGNYIYENNTANTQNVGNPVQDALEAINRSSTFSGLVNTFLEIKPHKNLILKTTFGIDYFSTKDKSFASDELKRAESSHGYAVLAQRDGQTWLSENTATYLKQFNRHSINAMLGFTAQKFSSESSVIAVAVIDDPSLGFYSFNRAKEKQMAGVGHTEWQMLSYLGRVNYSYNNRYLLTLTGRVDGSSKFGAGNKYGFFPALAVAWKVSEENFMRGSRTVSSLKIRTSIGRVGNEGIASYSSIGRMSNSEAYIYPSLIITGTYPYSLENEYLKWETTDQFDLGFDLGLLRERISLSGDFYYKKTSDLLLYMPTLLHSGYDAIMKNVGDMQNIGGEITLNVSPFRKRFSWDVDFSLGFNRNEVTNLAGTQTELIGSSVMGITYWTSIKEGKAIGTLYGYKTDGIVQLNEDPSTIPFFGGKTLRVGDRKYVDKNNDGVLDSDDLYELGNANPDFSFGFSNKFRYRLPDESALSLTIFIQGVYGNEIVNFNRLPLESFNGLRNNSTEALNRWTPSNPTNDYPRASVLFGQGYEVSDHIIEDGSYVRLKDVTLAYEFSNKLSGRLGLANLVVYTSLRNMLTLTNYTGYDPEVSRFANNNLSMGADYGSYPTARTIEMGIKLNF